MADDNLTDLAKRLRPLLMPAMSMVSGTVIEASAVSIIAGTGLTGGGLLTQDRTLSIDLAGNLTWTGTHVFQGSLTTRTILPELSDGYDLGSSTRLWRKGYLAELDAVVFAQQTVTLIGGWLIVGRDEGTYPADVASGATTINFGKAMTPGHFVLMRAAGKVEYLQVGTLVSGTTYNVTRNLDGSGANDWAAGTPFSVLGTTGNGRIELNAYDTPRINIFNQGTSYNTVTEPVRIGDLNGWDTVGTERYGIGLGDFSGGNYLRYEPGTGLVISGGSGGINVDANGLSLNMNESWTDQRSIRYVFEGSDVVNMGGYTSGGGTSTNFWLRAFVPTSTTLYSELGIFESSAQSLAILQSRDVSVYVWGQYPGTLERQIDLVADKVMIHGTDTRPWVYLTTPLTSTSWDGDSFSTTSKTLIDLSAVFSVPAGVKAVMVNVAMRDSASASGDRFLLLSPNNSANSSAVTVRCSGLANDSYTNESGVVPCDANGDIYYQIAASGSGTMDIYIEIWGYQV